MAGRLIHASIRHTVLLPVLVPVPVPLMPMRGLYLYLYIFLLPLVQEHGCQSICQQRRPSEDHALVSLTAESAILKKCSRISRTVTDEVTEKAAYESVVNSHRGTRLLSHHSLLELPHYLLHCTGLSRVAVIAVCR